MQIRRESENYEENDITENTITRAESLSNYNLTSDSEEYGQDENFEDAIQSQEPIRRISSRINKGVPPKRYGVNSAVLSPEPSNFNEAISIKEEMLLSIKAVEDELRSIQENNTWELVDLLPGRKVIGCKWVFEKKLNEIGEAERFKARLVAKGFNQSIIKQVKSFSSFSLPR